MTSPGTDQYVPAVRNFTMTDAIWYSVLTNEEQERSPSVTRELSICKMNDYDVAREQINMSQQRGTESNSNFSNLHRCAQSFVSGKFLFCSVSSFNDILRNPVSLSHTYSVYHSVCHACVNRFVSHYDIRTHQREVSTNSRWGLLEPLDHSHLGVAILMMLESLIL
jgi:hypothetical protein